jgi:hypothetical protein
MEDTSQYINFISGMFMGFFLRELFEVIWLGTAVLKGWLREKASRYENKS